VGRRFGLIFEIMTPFQKPQILAFFKLLPDFYLLWAEHYAQERSRSNFDRVMALCERNCRSVLGPQWDCQQVFEPLLVRYFSYVPQPQQEEDARGGETIALINILNGAGGRKGAENGSENRQMGGGRPYSAASTATMVTAQQYQTAESITISDYQRCMSTTGDGMGMSTYNGTLMADQASQQTVSSELSFIGVEKGLGVF